MLLESPRHVGACGGMWGHEVCGDMWRRVGVCAGMWALPLLYYFTPPNYWLKSFTPTGECEIRIPNSKVTQWINILKRILVFIFVVFVTLPSKVKQKIFLSDLWMKEAYY